MGIGLGAAMPRIEAWNLVDLVTLFVMWSVMMVAMMLPAVSGMLLAFATLNRRRSERHEPDVATAVFLCGYLLVWVGFSFLATLVQWGLQSAALLSPMMAGTSPILGGTLLIAAGIFQWTPIKDVCLTHCRSPMSFILSDWREGIGGAVLMGLHHGAFCVGCCWALMGLLFVAGVMTLLWVAALTVCVVVETLAPGVESQVPDLLQLFQPGGFEAMGFSRIHRSRSAGETLFGPGETEARNREIIGEKCGFVNASAVSYTHLTLPTKA